MRCLRLIPSRHSVIENRWDVVTLTGTPVDSGEVRTEICAYGTAVQAVPVTDGAKYTAQQLGYGGGA